MFTTLLYHIIDSSIEANVAISERAFELQLDHLMTRAYRILSLEEALQSLDGKRPAPTRSIVLTFDDGYSSVVQAALPRLMARGVPATLFVISSVVGLSNRWNPRACYDTYHLNWNELHFWVDCGYDIGGHTQSHLCLSRLQPDEMRDAILLDKEMLERTLSIRLRAFSYPYGAFNESARRVVRQVYDVAFSVDQGTWLPQRDRYTINRLVVSPRWGIDEFADRVERAVALCRE